MSALITADLDSARDALNLALQLLNKALDGNAESYGVTADEFDFIRQKRANRMLDAAKHLHAKITKTVTR